MGVGEGTEVTSGAGLGVGVEVIVGVGVAVTPGAVVTVGSGVGVMVGVGVGVGEGVGVGLTGFRVILAGVMLPVRTCALVSTIWISKLSIRIVAGSFSIEELERIEKDTN